LGLLEQDVQFPYLFIFGLELFVLRVNPGLESRV
jgi:hypothetical protein